MSQPAESVTSLTPVSEESLLRQAPAPRPVPVGHVREAVAAGRRLVVLDDDPTGTQTVRDMPVLTRWEIDDIRWALQSSAAAFFVLTNTRSLPPAQAAERNRAVAEACLQAAAMEGVDVAFASRSDSTLRGHFPLETDELAAVSAAHGQPIDGVIIVPAYVDAGRITVDSVHWVRTAEGMVPAGSSEFARDATFGYQQSYLPAWVEEKTGGRVASADVERITLQDLRVGGPELVAARLEKLHAGRTVVVDAVVDDDLRVLALAIVAAERAGRAFLYRVGPSFVRARAGQDRQPPLRPDQITRGSRLGGLIVVGSHVAMTTRQLQRLVERVSLTEIEIDVPTVADTAQAEQHVASVVAAAVAALAHGHVALRTTRAVVTGESGEASLGIARRVSMAVTAIVREIVAQQRPAFIVAKGGITSSDIATDGLGIMRARVRGTLLPGIVSLWEPVSGPAKNLPYVVFAGNVGDDEALADVVEGLAKI